MPGELGFEEMTPGQGGMLWQDPQLRDTLAQIMQTKQSLPPGAGQPSQAPPQSLQLPQGAISGAGIPGMPPQMPGAVPQMPSEPQVPEGILGNPSPQALNSAFKLPMKTARAKDFDPEWEGLDGIGDDKTAPGLRRS